ncbi:sigma-70 family RNA polymerase sigma factor [Nocardioides bigeumensis]|uniref:RNA polymerase sigma factor SigF n=1 Tax=Nocardioides bigeumensis TaxID=433657 RepID=A0ABN2Y464_9ACTN
MTTLQARSIQLDENPAAAERQRRGDALFADAAEQDGEAREDSLREVVVLYLPVAHSMALRYRNRGCELEDLEQVAGLALVKAAHGFDPAAGHDFMSYAVPSIRGTLRRYFRDYGWVIRPPRALQELQPRVRDELTRPEPDTGRPPSAEQIAGRLGASAAAVREAGSIQGCFAPASLDAPLAEVGTGVLADLVGGTDDGGYAAVDTQTLLSSVLAQLTVSERALLQLRFVDELSQQEIAEHIGTGQSQVSRRLRMLFERLRFLMGVEDPDQAPFAS